MTEFFYVLCGFMVGGLVGLSGVGGGSLMTPILILLFHQIPSVAVGTDLMFAAITKAVETSTFQSERQIEWPVVVRLLCGSLPASALAAGWLWHARHVGWDVSHLLTKMLAVVLSLTALSLLLMPTEARDSNGFTQACRRLTERHVGLLTMVAGAALGAMISLTSVGAGALGVLALSVLYGRKLTGARLVATDIAHALPIAMVASVNHMILGDVQYRNLVWLLIGSIPAVIIAARITMRLRAATVRRIIGSLLALVSTQLWISS